MCLIISAPTGKQIPLELLQDASDHNSDGWGVMYHTGKQIVVEKSPICAPEAIYDLTKANPHPTVVHLRMTTHGDNSHANTHPFEITSGRLYMMHNGIVDVAVPRGSRKSDTRVMVEDYLKPLVGNKPGRLQNPGLQRFIQSLIGESSNRLVFLDDTGKLTYFNKALGLEWKGLWCSNTYAWSLHSESRENSGDRRRKSAKRTSGTQHWRDYDSSVWDMRSWGSDPVCSSSVRPDQDDDDDFAWASGNDQAYDPHADIELDVGRITVPRWLADLLTSEYDDLLDEDTGTLAAALDELAPLLTRRLTIPFPTVNGSDFSWRAQ